MKPMWEEIEAEIPGLATEYYDADMDSEKLKEYEVKNVPAFVFVDKDGKEILRLKGVQNKEDLVKIINENIDK